MDERTDFCFSHWVMPLAVLAVASMMLDSCCGNSWTAKSTANIAKTTAKNKNAGILFTNRFTSSLKWKEYKRRMKFTRLFVPLIIFAGICTAQSADNSEKKSEAIATRATQPPSAEISNLRLTIMKTVISPELINGIAERGCDEDGNVYLGSDSAIQPAIRKFNANGELVATFKPDTIPDVKFGFAGHFFVAPDGELYQLVGAKDSFNRYVLIFKNDGSFKSSIKLD